MTPTSNVPDPSIPTHLESDVQRLHDEGLTSREIATWMKEQHQVVTSHASVLRLLRRMAHEAALEKLEATRHQIVEELPGDLVTFNDAVATMRDLGHRAISAMERKDSHAIPYIAQTHRLFRDQAKLLEGKFRRAGLEERAPGDKAPPVRG